MKNETQRLNENIEKALETLEKAQVSIAENIDALLIRMGEVEAAIYDLKQQLGKTESLHTVEDEDDIDGPDDLTNFDADDDLSDEDMRKLGYDIN